MWPLGALERVPEGPSSNGAPDVLGHAGANAQAAAPKPLAGKPPPALLSGPGALTHRVLYHSVPSGPYLE